MMTHRISINTRQYEAVHGHTPRQARFHSTSTWTFAIDTDPTPVFIIASYAGAVKQAKALARSSITVLP